MAKHIYMIAVKETKTGRIKKEPIIEVKSIYKAKELKKGLDPYLKEGYEITLLRKD